MSLSASWMSPFTMGLSVSTVLAIRLTSISVRRSARNARAVCRTTDANDRLNWLYINIKFIRLLFCFSDYAAAQFGLGRPRLFQGLSQCDQREVLLWALKSQASLWCQLTIMKHVHFSVFLNYW